MFAACRSAGIDPAREPIPIAPAAHYHMGGILTDAHGRSTVDGLWACGEVASTGAHGANRLASNSLLEAVVFGARVARDVARVLPMAVPVKPRAIRTPARCALRPKRQGRAEAAADHGRRCRRRPRCGSLTNALLTICALERDAHGDRRLGNMLSTAKLIAAAALLREESRGAQFRSDYPKPDEELAERSFLTLADADAIANEAAESRAEPPSCMPRRPAQRSMHERETLFR